MTVSDPKATAEETMASVYPSSLPWDQGTRLAFAADALAALRDAGFVVVRLDDATRERMVGAAQVEAYAQTNGGTELTGSVTRLARLILDAALGVLVSSTQGETR